MKNLIIALLSVLLIAAVIYITVEVVEAPDNDSESAISQQTVTEFKTKLETDFIENVGQPIEGFEPGMFLSRYPNLQASDFDGVDALIGHYVFMEGELKHDLEGTELIHSAAGAITETGYEKLLENLVKRLDVESEEIFEYLISSDGPESGETPTPTPSPALPETPDPDPSSVACTKEAKICPDGSAVGRVGPNCEFAACPVSSESKTVTCTEQMKKAEACTMEYAPVCGLVQVQCITTPCDPIPETFSNGCVACSRGNVISYTEGECSL